MIIFSVFSVFVEFAPSLLRAAIHFYCLILVHSELLKIDALIHLSGDCVEDCLKTDKYCDWFLNNAEYWSYRCCMVSFKLLKSCVEMTDIYHTD